MLKKFYSLKQLENQGLTINYEDLEYFEENLNNEIELYLDAETLKVFTKNNCYIADAVSIKLIYLQQELINTEYSLSKLDEMMNENGYIPSSERTIENIDKYKSVIYTSSNNIDIIINFTISNNANSIINNLIINNISRF